MWASELDDFPAAVTAHHFPDMVQLGDITKINVDELTPVDIICAGSPCQDLSVAGKREGLAGERSGLFRTAIELVHGLRARTGKPRYFVWENVPGAFSSNKGLDFRAVLEEISQTSIPVPDGGKWANAGLAELPKCEIAWRIIDAQHHIPQRRKRIFLIADFTAEQRCAGEILFISESLSGNPAEGERKREENTRNAEASTCIASELYENHGTDSRVTGPLDKCPTMASRWGTGGNNIPLVRSGNMVRRLTPAEAEQLQGLPVGYTDIDFHGKPAPDSRRYKALGNGMAQPCADYVIKRIVDNYIGNA